MSNPNLNNHVRPFIVKLQSLVNDPNTDSAIHWCDNGLSFLIHHQSEEWYTILPAYYTHSSLPSFVRQLNMYGFYKLSRQLNANPTDTWEFSHPFFLKDQPELLINIKRKISTNAKDNDSIMTNAYLQQILGELRSQANRQTRFELALNNLQLENNYLWHELSIILEKQKKQLETLCQYFLSFVPSDDPEKIVKKQKVGSISAKNMCQNPRSIHTEQSDSPVTSDGQTLCDIANEICIDNSTEAHACDVPILDKTELKCTVSVPVNLFGENVKNPKKKLKRDKNMHHSSIDPRCVLDVKTENNKISEASNSNDVDQESDAEVNQRDGVVNVNMNLGEEFRQFLESVLSNTVYLSN
ncbi:hypothetical protein RN001_015805 [Aquatica leii]|uniref:HSF-type DNA-binding domain-containing protein n=1 Tax=Aquatica leii TaxID=1421715 RepID=A0AAN7S5U7_9COLE|nr:hypothetical protein RN001_015805 [Aquatica leii]